MNTIFYNDYNSISRNKPTDEHKDPSRNIDKAIVDESLFDRIFRVLFQCFGLRRQEGVKTSEISVEVKHDTNPINSSTVQVITNVDTSLDGGEGKLLSVAGQESPPVFTPPSKKVKSGTSTEKKSETNIKPTNPSAHTSIYGRSVTSGKASCNSSFDFMNEEAQAPQQNFSKEFEKLETKFKEFKKALTVYLNYGSTDSDRDKALHLAREIQNGIDNIKPRDSVDINSLERFESQFKTMLQHYNL